MKPKDVSKSRGKRALEPHEAELWKIVTRHVNPLRRRKRAAEALPVEEPPQKETKPANKPVKQAKPMKVSAVAKPVVAPPVAKPALLPLAPVERRTRQRLSRGQIEVDARIDLHGMRQATAHVQLIGFLHRAQAAGGRVVIVVTGKGSTRVADDAMPFREAGVLRRAVPQWLSAPELRTVVLGFEEASARHGGSGALYVRLRSRGARMSDP
ncbi:MULTISPECIES: Smr/MutS family protein [unclassified Beijerinckia]|uniref:Smr/MutS family protein n=1 Tax=unclassified Beijerinckia TaxID=2638183 RepID=UPI0008946E0C|nr:MULTISPECIES: Smr/MutS family protein [unclassified Beijerinckia]MDH7797989.1 DNA-nicking Smr family endonuclease [Beijerinckia sp. GAS462]SED05119.1 DNA-nicking endonuclease, Smr domain [Beijerinckia sp. 28-YEA-48]